LFPYGEIGRPNVYTWQEYQLSSASTVQREDGATFILANYNRVSGSSVKGFSTIKLRGVSFSEYELQRGRVLLEKTTETLDGVTTITDYTYRPDRAHLNPISTTFTNSDGKVYRTEQKYAHELAADYPCLLSKHMISIPIESRKFVDNVLTGGTRTAFKTYHNGEWCLPEKVTEILADDTEVDRITIDDYSGRAKPTQIQLMAFEPEVYTW